MWKLTALVQRHMHSFIYIDKGQSWTYIKNRETKATKKVLFVQSHSSTTRIYLGFFLSHSRRAQKKALLNYLYKTHTLSQTQASDDERI